MRLDLRIDAALKAKLHDLAAEAGVSLSEMVRRLIEAAHHDLQARRRREAADRIAACALEVPSDPTEVARILETAHAADLP
jgi:hypothetical protein